VLLAFLFFFPSIICSAAAVLIVYFSLVHALYLFEGPPDRASPVDEINMINI